MRTCLHAGLVCGSLLLVPFAAHAATRSYPGAAPCDSTLQACIDAANSGDRIELTSSAQVLEDLTIAKSLTLASAAGNTGWLGGERVPEDDWNPHTITVSETPGGAATAVTFSNLKITADVNVTYATGSGHLFELLGCQLVRQNQTGDDLPLTVYVTPKVATDIHMLNNYVDAAETNLHVDVAAVSSSSVVNLDVAGNRFVGDAFIDESASAIWIDVDEGTVHAQIRDNLIHRYFGVGAQGWAFNLEHNDYFGSDLAGEIDITNNTVDLVDSAAASGLIAGLSPKVALNVYNNIFSHMSAFGGAIDPMSAGYNDFFAVPYYDPSEIDHPELQLTVDPGYLDPDHLDFHLRSDSLLINAGLSSPPGGERSTDLDGAPRIVGPAVDVGCYEVQPPSSTGGAGGAAGGSGAGGAAGGSTGGAAGNGGASTGGAAGSAAGNGGVAGSIAGNSGANGEAGGGISAGGTAGESGGTSTGGTSTGGTSAGAMSSGGAAGQPYGGAAGSGRAGNAGAAGFTPVPTPPPSKQSKDDSSCALRAGQPASRSSWPLLLLALLLARRRRAKRR